MPFPDKSLPNQTKQDQVYRARSRSLKKGQRGSFHLEEQRGSHVCCLETFWLWYCAASRMGWLPVSGSHRPGSMRCYARQSTGSDDDLLAPTRQTALEVKGSRLHEHPE